MLRKLLISSFLLAPSLATAEPHFKLGILWSSFGPKVTENIVLQGDEETQRTMTSLIDENKNTITGNDSDRVTGIIPRISDVTAMEMATGRYGATLSGQHLYKKELTKSLKYRPLKDKSANFSSAIPQLEDFGTIKKLPLRYSEITNAVSAKGVVVVGPSDGTTYRWNWNAKVNIINNEKEECGVYFSLNGEAQNKTSEESAWDDVQNSQVAIARSEKKNSGPNGEYSYLVPFPIKGQIVTQLKRGSNVFEIFLVCPQNNNWVGSHKRSRTVLKGVSKKPKDSLLENGSIQSFQFNVIDWQAQKPVSAIRDYQLIRDDTEAPLYSDAAKALPNLWVWQACTSCEFEDVATREFSSNENQTGAKAMLRAVDTSDIELIDPRMQELDEVYQGSNGLRTMIKGTYYPKNTGTHEIIVVKKSNILAYMGVDAYGNKNAPNLSPSEVITAIRSERKSQNENGILPWGSASAVYRDKARSASVMPHYSIAFDYSKPVAHSKITQSGYSPMPLEYDWFWFDTNGQDIEYGMDMSIYLQGITGPTRDSSVYIEEGKKIYTPAQAQREKLKRSQRIGIFIKPAGEDKFRPFQASDFARLDGSTTRQGSDTGNTESNREADDSFDLLGGFD